MGGLSADGLHRSRGSGPSSIGPPARIYPLETVCRADRDSDSSIFRLASLKSPSQVIAGRHT